MRYSLYYAGLGYFYVRPFDGNNRVESIAIDPEDCNEFNDVKVGDLFRIVRIDNDENTV